MADTVETMIAGIHAYLDAKLGVGNEVPYGIGRTELMKADVPPRVVWADTTGNLNPSRRGGGNPAECALDLGRFEVHIWHTTRETARLLMHNLVVSARNRWDGPSVKWGAYDWLVAGDAQYLKLGVAVVAQVTITCAVEDAISSTVVATGIGGGDAVYEFPDGDEVVATVPGFPP